MSTRMMFEEENQLQSVEMQIANQPLILKILAKIFSYIFHPVFVPVYIVYFMLYLPYQVLQIAI